ncbi:hypothetical protein WMZ97_03300 [Lentibacillus sp. N15]
MNWSKNWAENYLIRKSGGFYGSLIKKKEKGWNVYDGLVLDGQ